MGRLIIVLVVLLVIALCSSAFNYGRYKSVDKRLKNERSRKLFEANLNELADKISKRK